MKTSYDKYIISAIKELPDSQEDFLFLKKKLAKRYGLSIPTNADLRERYNELVLQKKIRPSKKLENILMSRKIRTQSGVAVVAVLTKSYPCPGKCIYCPTEKQMPKSYLSNEPAVMRAIASNFDPYLQVQNRLRSLELNGHKTDKIELIVMGGTFSYLPKSYQQRFITQCFRACNDYPHCHPNRGKGSPDSYATAKALCDTRSATPQNDKLLCQQKKNEKSKHRIIGLTLETRPDYINEKEIINFRNLGCTRVELGVQSIFDDVLSANKRGHLIASTVRATKMLKNAGFKINYHIMPGLLGSTLQRDFEMLRTLFSDSRFQPDMLKIYPAVVLKSSLLFTLWRKKQYKPLANKELERLIIKIKNKVIPPYVRISRLIRDVPTTSIQAGPTVSNLRQVIAKKANCQCIRCREVRGGYLIHEKIILDRINYEASDGKEIFLQYVSEDKKKLFALLRLRIPTDKNKKYFIRALENSAIVREVHTYGKLTEINKKSSDSPQHIGLGKKLLLEAEKIAKNEFDLKKIAVISGVGVRGYYRKFGYKLKDTYMVKKI